MFDAESGMAWSALPLLRTNQQLGLASGVRVPTAAQVGATRAEGRL